MIVRHRFHVRLLAEVGPDSNWVSFLEKLGAILRTAIPKKTEIVNNKIYEGWTDFFTEFCRVGGVIESCPTGSLSNIYSPAISFLFEPDGNVQTVCTYDKLNVGYFKNFGLSSPQAAIPADVINKII